MNLKMNYKLLIFFFAIILPGCVAQIEKKQLDIESGKIPFINKGSKILFFFLLKKLNCGCLNRLSSVINHFFYNF